MLNFCCGLKKFSPGYNLFNFSGLMSYTSPARGVVNDPSLALPLEGRGKGWGKVTLLFQAMNRAFIGETREPSRIGHTFHSSKISIFTF
jgi:hypothetical protein